jgi:hypothetical protein
MTADVMVSWKLPDVSNAGEPFGCGDTVRFYVKVSGVPAVFG